MFEIIKIFQHHQFRLNSKANSINNSNNNKNFTYSDADPSCIISCDLSNAKVIGEGNVNTENGGICAEALFPIGSTWKDITLLFYTVKTYSARTRWKYCLKQLCEIRCSCCKTSNINRSMSEGSINKSCTWMINMKSSKYSDTVMGGGHPQKWED